MTMRVTNAITNQFDGKKYALSKNPMVELNIVRSIGPSLLNRGEHGEAKMVLDRSRLSSQCTRHEIRKEIHRLFDETPVRDTVRTNYFLEMVKDRLDSLELSEEELDKFTDFLLYMISSSEKEVLSKEKRTNTMHQLTFDEANAIFDYALKDELFASILEMPRKKATKKKKADEEEVSEEIETDKWDYSKVKFDKDKLMEILHSMPLSYEIALFGRFDAALGRIDGAIGNGHSYSLEAFANDYDYFVANDTLLENLFDGPDKRKMNPGAGILSEKDVVSNTMYNYTYVNPSILIHNLSLGRDISKKDVRDAIINEAIDLIEAYIWCCVEVHPSAHQKDMATFSNPTFMYATIGNDVKNESLDSVFIRKTFRTEGEKAVDEIAQEHMITHLGINPFNRNTYVKRSLVTMLDVTASQKELLDKKNITVDETLDAFLDTVKKELESIEFVEVN